MIGKATFQSAGKISQHIIPGAYSRFDSVKGGAGLISVGNGVVMGKSGGGEPTKLLQFNSPAEALATLRDGELLEAIRLAFDPGGGIVPQRLFAMRVNIAIASLVYLKNGASDNMVKITSRDWGLYTNQIKVKLETGTSYGKKFTVSFQSETEEVFDNIRRQSFTIQSSKGTTSVTMTIVNSSGAHTLTTQVDGSGTDLNITLTDYNVVGELVAYINNQTGYTCSAIAGQENASPLELDSVTAVAIKASPYTAESTMEAIIDTINAGASRVKAEAANAAIARVIPANLALVFMSGGSDGPYTSTEWTAALTALEAEDVQFVATPSSDAGVHSSIKTHCVLMSSVTGKKERQFFVGSAWKTSVKATEIANAKAASIALNSYVGGYYFNGGTQYNKDNVLTQFGGSYAACMAMGLATALAINEPLTRKELNFIELEWKLSDSELEGLLENAVAPINYMADGTIRLVRQLNCYQTDDLKLNEFSMVREAFFVSRDLRTYLDTTFIGKPTVSLTQGVLKGAVESKLMQYTVLGIFITHPTEDRAWWGVSISIVGDTVTIDYDAYLTAPTNFIFITAHFHDLVALAAAA